MVKLGFDVDKAPERNTPVPAGTYKMRVKSTEQKRSKSDDKNAYLEVKMTIAEGPSKGRVISEILNLWNKSEQARQISEATLGELAKACGIRGKLADSAELHNKLVVADVIVEQRVDKDGNPRKNNKITKYTSITTTSKKGASTRPPLPDVGDTVADDEVQDAIDTQEEEESTEDSAPWA